MFGGQYLCLIKGETEARAGPSGICMVSFGLTCEAGIWTQVRLVPKHGFFPWCFPSIVVIRAKRKWSEQELLCISTSFKASLSIWLFLPLCAPPYYNDWERFHITRLALLFRRHTKRVTKIPRAYIYLWCLVFLPTFSAAALLRVMGVHLRGHCLLFWGTPVLFPKDWRPDTDSSEHLNLPGSMEGLYALQRSAKECRVPGLLCKSPCSFSKDWVGFTG